MLWRCVLILLALSAWPACGQDAVVTVPGEPENLDLVKQQLVHYHSCMEMTCYVPQMERQIDTAVRFLKQSVAARKPGEKLAMVLDIDETSLSNWAVEQRDDFGYIPADFNSCVSVWCAKAIPATLRLYKEAEKDNVAVFFISGRPQSQQADTEANLKVEGYDHWAQVYLRPLDRPKTKTASEFKSGERRKIVEQGYRIVLNVGDQMSDLEGSPQAEHSVKLPNPFYRIP